MYTATVCVLTGLCWLRLPAAGSHGLLSKLLRFSALAGPVLLANVETAIILLTSAGTFAFKDWNRRAIQFFRLLQQCSVVFVLTGYYAPSLSVQGWEAMKQLRLVRSSSASGFVGLDQALGVSKQDLSSKIGQRLGNQHQRQWQDLGRSQWQARELISGPNQGNRDKFLSFSRQQSRVVTGLLTGYNTLCRHLHLMGLIDSPLCRKCGVEDETSAHILHRCEALASIRRAHLGCSFLEPEDIKNQNLGAIWRFSKAAGLPWGMFGVQRAGL
jgi:hypothetical protein